MSKLLRVAALSLVLGAAAVASGSASTDITAPSAAPAAVPPGSVMNVPVSFTVKNTNRSELACSSDGKEYEIRGRLIGPAELLASRPAELLATLYLHEYSFGKFFWNFTADPAYDHVTAMASLGHVSVTVDRLGYDESSQPLGGDICIGSHADILSQIVSQLRAGKYGVAEGEAWKLDRIVVAGHSVGAAVAELAAFSFPDMDIEALIIYAWSDQGFSRRTVQQSLAQSGRCARGGDPGEPGEPEEYAYYGESAAEFHENVFFSAEPSIVEEATRLRNRDPCGDAASLTRATIVNGSNVDEIDLPVLLLFGRNDTVFTEDAPAAAEDAFSGSDDVTLRVFDDTAHAMTLERSAPLSRATVVTWLLERQLVSKGARTVFGCPIFNPTSVGSVGADEITGGPGDDNVVGGEGADRVDGAGGDDCIDGGDDNDALVGADGDDHLLGQAGDDQLAGGEGDDRLEGGPGNDHVLGGAGDEEIWGGEGSDRIFAQSGANLVWGGAGDDLLVGADSNDALYGSTGNDQLRGRGGRDILFSDVGKDTLNPGAGRDVVHAGAGADLIKARDGSRDVIRCGPGRDRARVDALDRTFGCETVKRATSRNALEDAEPVKS